MSGFLSKLGHNKDAFQMNQVGTKSKHQPEEVKGVSFCLLHPSPFFMSNFTFNYRFFCVIKKYPYLCI